MKTLGLTGAKPLKLAFEPITGTSDSTLAAATAAIPENARVSFDLRPPPLE